MTQETLLTLLKIDLQISVSSTEYDMHLQGYIKLAQAAIENMGISIDPTSEEDGMLIKEYAAEMYRGRKENKSMSSMLKLQLNNRLFKEKAGGVF